MYTYTIIENTLYTSDQNRWRIKNGLPESFSNLLDFKHLKRVSKLPLNEWLKKGKDQHPVLIHLENCPPPQKKRCVRGDTGLTVTKGN